VEGKFMVYRDSDNKTLKSIKYSPADMRAVLLTTPWEERRSYRGRRRERADQTEIRIPNIKTHTTI
jgi:hypothetical protein